MQLVGFNIWTSEIKEIPWSKGLIRIRFQIAGPLELVDVSKHPNWILGPRMPSVVGDCRSFRSSHPSSGEVKSSQHWLPCNFGCRHQPPAAGRNALHTKGKQWMFFRGFSKLMAYSLLNMLSMKIDLWVFAELANTHIFSSVGRANGLLPEISVQSHWLPNVPRSLWALPMCTRLPQCLESIGDGSFHFEWENGQPFFCCILLYQIKPCCSMFLPMLIPRTRYKLCISCGLKKKSSSLCFARPHTIQAQYVAYESLMLLNAYIYILHNLHTYIVNYA